MKMNARRLVWYWMPVIAWMSLIFIASTNLMSAQHTSRFIGPFLRWIAPHISIENIQAVQFLARKAAHVTEYAILAALSLRAFSSGERRLHRSHVIFAVSIAGTCAAIDEFHQSFVASRTGAVGDVMIDISGAVLGAAICWMVINRGISSRAAAADAV
jgi:VanZ family protein